MKKIILTILIGLSFSPIFGQTQKSISPIVSQAYDYINLIEKKYNQQIVHLEFDVINSQKQVYRQLFKDVQYGIIIFGDEQISKLKLDISRIIDNNWKIVATDNEGKGIVMIYFQPKKTDLYQFNITATLKQSNSFGFYGFIIFR
jgi:hypothetical protein